MKSRIITKYRGGNRKPFVLMTPVLTCLFLVGIAGFSGCKDKTEPNFKKFTVAKPIPPVPKGQLPYVTNEFLVIYKSASSPEEEKTRPKSRFFGNWINLRRAGDPKTSMELLATQQEIIQKLGKELISEYKGDIDSVLQTMPLSGIQHMKISSNSTYEKIKEKLGKDSKIEKVERVYKVYPLSHATPGQPPNEKLWHDHEATDPTLSRLWALQQINMHKAWEKASVVWGNAPIDPSKEVVVGLIDTGLAVSHPDLKDALWINRAEKDGTPGQDEPDEIEPLKYVDDINGFNFLADTPEIQTLSQTHCNEKQEGTDLSDTIQHGTNVAGPIAAIGNNFLGEQGDKTGLVGVNGNGQVKIMVLKVWCSGKTQKFWTTTPSVVAAIQYAIAMEAKVINASWTLEPGIPRNEISHLETAIKKANDEGVLFVVAAGNVGDNHDSTDFEVYPASFHEMDNVIVVAATTRTDGLKMSSDFGETGETNEEEALKRVTVHIGAPGVGILTTSADLNFPIQISKDTSMAAPFVSGCAAFIQAQRKLKNRPPLEPLDLKKLLWKSAKKVEWVTEDGKKINGRRLDCEQAYIQGA